MIDLDTIGYYLYMEEQENRSRESKQAAESEQASQEPPDRVSTFRSAEALAFAAGGGYNKGCGAAAKIHR